MRKPIGVTLIELMVVIAIVAILAAIAAPSYTRYLVGSRMVELGAVVTDLMRQSIDIAAQQQHFANAYDLELSTTPGATVADDDLAAALVGKFYLSYSDGGGLTIADTSSGCGASGEITLRADPTKIGIASNLGTSQALIDCVFWHHNDTVENYCTYSYKINGTYYTGQLAPGWINSHDSNAPTIPASWSDKTCM